MAYEAYQLSLKGKPAAGDRRADGRPALLPVLGAGLARASIATGRCASRCSRIRTARRTSVVNGSVRNMDAWYKAFDVQPGDKLYLKPEERVSIW